MQPLETPKYEPQCRWTVEKEVEQKNWCLRYIKRGGMMSAPLWRGAAFARSSISRGWQPRIWTEITDLDTVDQAPRSRRLRDSITLPLTTPLPCFALSNPDKEGCRILQGVQARVLGAKAKVCRPT